MQFENIRFGAEVYTWFMKENGKAHENRLDHMIEVTAKAGFSSIEPVFHWMGDLIDPIKLKDCLQKNAIDMSVLVLCLPWNESQETDEERKTTDDIIAFLKHFPETMICTVQLPTGRHDVDTRRIHLVNNLNAVSKRAADAGIEVSFHPNSPESSITRTEEDYNIIFDKLDTSVTGWTPDVGHIINAGMDPLAKMKQYADLINLVHFKDWDGEPEFALMGKGAVNFIEITQWLVDRNFDGWVICEDEAEQAVEDPDGVTLHDGKWIKETLIPALKRPATV